MKAIGYTRVSTPTQAKYGGLQMQTDCIKKYCELCNIDLLAVFSDNGISALEHNRRGLRDMIEQLCEIEDCVVIVYSIDRIWRDKELMSNIKKALSNLGSEVMSIKEPTYSIYKKSSVRDRINNNSDIGTIRSREEINKTLKCARKNRAEHGFKPCGALPIGYEWNNREIVVNEEKSKMIKDIFITYISTKSLGKTIKCCKLKEYKTNSNKDFTKESIRQIIMNDFYIGMLNYAGEKTTGTQEAIISDNIYEKANEILNRRNVN